MKEKIGKLLELLNEYELGEDYGDMGEYYYIDTLGNIVDDGGYILKPCEIISKKFGFIKWLVENDKIDTDAYKTVYSGDLDKRKALTMSSGGDEFYQVTEHGVYESLLMLLSISNSPIEDLLLYLK